MLVHAVKKERGQTKERDGIKARRQDRDDLVNVMDDGQDALVKVERRLEVT